MQKKMQEIAEKNILKIWEIKKKMYLGKKQQKTYTSILLTHEPKPGETKVSRSRVTHRSDGRRRPSASLSRRGKARVALSTLESGCLELKTVFNLYLQARCQMWFCHLTSFLSFRVRHNQWQAPQNFVGLIFPKKFFTSRWKIMSLVVVLGTTTTYLVGSWLKNTHTKSSLSIRLLVMTLYTHECATVITTA